MKFSGKVGNILMLITCLNVFRYYENEIQHKVQQQKIQLTVDWYSALSWTTHLNCPQVWYMLTRDHTVLPVTNTFIHKWNKAIVDSILRPRYADTN